MDEPLAVKSLNFGTVFKIVFWSGLCVWIIIAGLVVIFAFLAPGVITVNGAQATSTPQALVAAPIFLICGAAASSIFAAAGACMVRLFGRFLPLGKIQTAE